MNNDKCLKIDCLKSIYSPFDILCQDHLEENKSLTKNQIIDAEKKIFIKKIQFFFLQNMETLEEKINVFNNICTCLLNNIYYTVTIDNKFYVAVINKLNEVKNKKTLNENNKNFYINTQIKIESYKKNPYLYDMKEYLHEEYIILQQNFKIGQIQINILIEEIETEIDKLSKKTTINDIIIIDNNNDDQKYILEI